MAKKNCVKNWERIALDRKANDIIIRSYDYNITKDTGWYMLVKNCVSKIGLSTIFTKKTKKCPNAIVFCRERDIFHQEAFSQIQNASKLQTFSLVKTNIGIENYLIDVQNVPERISLSKLRLSNHTLMIETGRHKKIEREKRFCPFCSSKVEDEFHFIVECPIYNHLRWELWNIIKRTMPDYY